MGLAMEQVADPGTSNLTDVEIASYENFLVNLANVKKNPYHFSI